MMARLARFIIPNIAHHVTQRGNGQQQTFFCDEDYAIYRDLLCKQGDAGANFSGKWEQQRCVDAQVDSCAVDFASQFMDAIVNMKAFIRQGVM